MDHFELVSEYKPMGDQPQAIEQLTKGFKEGNQFATTYENFLSLTGKMNLEDVGKSVGIDLTSEDFWQNSIDMIQEDIYLFERLLREV